MHKHSRSTFIRQPHDGTRRTMCRGYSPWWAVGLLAWVVSHSALAVEADQFTDVSESSGVAFVHQTAVTILDKDSLIAATDADLNQINRMNARAEITTLWHDGGVASGDYDGDGWPDLYAIGGDTGNSRLFQNNGDGTFIDKAEVAGVQIISESRGGVVFVDYNGDGDLDLFVGGLLGGRPKLFRNDGPNGEGETTFSDVFSSVFPTYDAMLTPNNWGGSFSDYDRDGDLDVYFAHSMTPFGPNAVASPGDSTQSLWRNDGATFTDVSFAAGITGIYDPNDQLLRKDQSFAPSFADVDEDGWPDLLIAADTGGSRILINQSDGTFADITVSSQFQIAGMGAAVGDFNNDGHLDWFISQIRGLNDGNRLYKGNGDGTFIDLVKTTEPFPAIGVESGHWGWGACMSDLDNDRYLDIVHVNGFYWDGNVFTDDGLFTNTAAVAFISNGNGTFTDRAEFVGLDDTGEGRGISCLDFDRDGDVDIAISNHRGPFKLFRNDLTADAGFVTIRLEGLLKNSMAISSRVYLRSLGGGESSPVKLMRQMSIDANFTSTNLTEAHFGIGGWQGPFEAEVHWPDGEVSLHSPLARNSFVTLIQHSDNIHLDGFE